MWVNENLQNQEGKNLDMHGKVFTSFYQNLFLTEVTR